MELSPAPVTDGRWADLSEDIALAVASLLPVRVYNSLSLSLSVIYDSLVDSTGSNLAQEADVCALGGCSRSWRRACDDDCVWEGLFRRRWPATAAAVVAGGREGASGVQVGKESNVFMPIYLSQLNFSA